MSSELQYVTVNKLIETLNPILDGIKQVDVYFCDYVESLYYKGKHNIKPIAFAFDGQLVDNEKIWDLLPDILYLTNLTDKWFKRPPLSKILCRVMIKTETKEYNGYKYHPSKVQELGNEKLQKKLEKRLSDDRVTRVNKLAEKCNIEEEFDEIEIDPEAL